MTYQSILTIYKILERKESIKVSELDLMINKHKNINYKINDDYIIIMFNQKKKGNILKNLIIRKENE